MATPLTPQQAFRCANTIRILSAEAIEKANSGHPGLPMGAADMAVALWGGFLHFNPKDTAWANRDRFVLSAGHGSMLLYSLLHMFGFELSMDEIKRFRQWGSKTAGHPEFGHTPGVEVTTGPLGQGIANSVGMALASKMAAERFNTADFSPITHKVYALVGDGDLQEGISYEAAALAGHLKLGNLICLYDSNSITIEGSTSMAWSEDVTGRFNAAGWHVQAVDGHDHSALMHAIQAAASVTDRPSMIICTTKIAFGCLGKEGSSSAHGSPLSQDEIAATKTNLGYDVPPFTVPDDVTALCAQRISELKAVYDAWQHGFAAWRTAHPDKAELWDTSWQHALPKNLAEELLAVVAGKDGATRALSGAVLQKAASLLPHLVGGSADLAPSNNSDVKGAGDVQAEAYGGKNLHFGIREHAMGAICNGLSLYGCFVPYGATFLVFSDYCRPAVRLSALMQRQVIYIFTHDSYAVGEDGPTHQPIEHTASLRLIPGVQVIRPADGHETALAWYAALKYQCGPTVLVLTRQKLPVLERPAGWDPASPLKGGYTVLDCASPDVVLMASGSEVSLAIDAARLLAGKAVNARVISVPDVTTFMAQPSAYRAALMPAGVPRVALEAGRSESFARLLGEEGLFIGWEQFGASAPAEVLAEQFGLTPDHVAQRVQGFIGKA